MNATTTETIVTKLNDIVTAYTDHGDDGYDYTGDWTGDLWHYVQTNLDVDWDATQAADPSDAPNVIVLTNGDTIRWNEQTRQWYQA